MRRLLAGLAITLTLAACGGGKDKVSTATTAATTSTTVAPTTTAPPATAPPVTAAPTPTTARPVAAAVTGGGYGWAANARPLLGVNGRRFTIGCPGGGGFGSVWGSGPYTADSSVCTAGVHAGAITQAAGGGVLIEIRPGESAYAASTQRGVTSKAYGKYDGSYVVIGRAAIPGGGYGYGANARQLRGKNGERFAFGCPAGGTGGSLYGSNPYTDDSSPCRAGVHAGVITLAAGGNVIIEIRPGQASYPSSPAHGITPTPYGKWDGSFVVVK